MYIYIEKFLFLTQFYVDSQRVLRVDHLFYVETYNYRKFITHIFHIINTGVKLQNVDLYYGYWLVLKFLQETLE